MRADITELEASKNYIFSNTVVHFEMNKFKFLQPYSESLIRLGCDHDGGYLIPEVLFDKKIKLISFGIGWDCSFETDWYNTISQKVVSYDSTDLYLENSIYDKNARFENICIDSESIKYILDKEATELFFIKMDIEKAEYENTLEQLILNEYCVGFVAEFHGIRIDDDGNDTDCTSTFRRLIQLIKNKYNIVHIHCNNIPYPGFILNEMHSKHEIPVDVIEITVLRKDYCSTTMLRKNSLVDVDKRNHSANPEINLIF